MKTHLYTTLCRSLPSETNTDDAPLWLPLIPVGAFAGRDGRSWNNSDPELVIKNTALPLILDADHASETSNNTVASGWITKLRIEDNHIVGLLNLNTLGKKVIEDKQYKLYSPAFNVTKTKDDNGIEVHHRTGGLEIKAFAALESDKTQILPLN